jgi:phosphoribosylformimino-5-aminoimidazole carboxamide ribotide isomerase
VLDLLGGVVVRGVGGRRHEYQPIQSILCGDPSPVSVGRALAGQLGATQTYVADLDAIGGTPPDLATYTELIGCGLDLWVDAGLASARQAETLADFQVEGQPLAAIVAGLESLPGPDVLREVVSVVGVGRLVFSLDLKAGQPLTAEAAWRELSPEQIVDLVIEVGVRRLIVLDLASVGMHNGVTTEALCRRTRQRNPGVEIVTGGGVRGRDDLDRLKHIGCDGVLVASALHDGRLTARDLAEFEFCQ